jgi:Predicted phosphohydrolases
MDRRQAIAMSAAFSLMGAKAAAAKPQKPHFRIGVVTDTQYADKDDVENHHYRLAPARLAEAVETLRGAGIDAGFYLGDFIDGGYENYSRVLPIAQRLPVPFHFLLGNHDFSIAEDKKAGLYSLLGMPSRYYTVEHKGWIFVILDGTDVSTFGWPAGSPEDVKARAIKTEKYPDAPVWNGAIGEAQLAWLDAVLEKAGKQGKQVALLCHFALDQGVEHNLWNAPEVISRIVPHACVKLWLNGHNHAGHYGTVSGIHCLNLKGMLDTDQTAYAALSFYAGKVMVHGYGRQENQTLVLR